MTVPSTKAGGADGVHRLVDMVVEEVSLVDRAANKHRFLIVKRDDAMPDPQPSAAAVEAVSTTMSAAPAGDSAAKAWPVADGSPLAAALGALESLTAIVELLGSLGADTSDTRLAALAQQLRTAADEILERTGFAETDESSEAAAEPEPAAPMSEVEARAKSERSSPPPPPRDLAANVSAAKRALGRLTELVSKALPAKTEKTEVPATPSVAPPPKVDEGLAKLAASVQELANAVKEQQQRIRCVEKQFGLPNSTRHAERAPAASHDDVGWPLDLNHPQDKASVDKSLSFHDL